MKDDIKGKLWGIRNDLKYIFINYFVSNIPCWWIRRFFL